MRPYYRLALVGMVYLFFGLAIKINYEYTSTEEETAIKLFYDLDYDRTARPSLSYSNGKDVKKYV